MNNIVLGIESSCDETAASICENGKIINNVIATQSVHTKYGGVVPELASREHMKNIVPVVNEALSNANRSVNDVGAIAVAQGPGLLGALLVGYSFAKSMSFALDIPLINVHHMRAHISAHFITNPVPKFPFLCLTVSGGHTQIVKVSSHTEMEVLGQTLDDAVGEAFDKGAKLLDLPYPGGPLIDQYAKAGDKHAFSFSKSNIPGLNYSFSGIKTSLLYFLREKITGNKNFIKENLSDICASYQSILIEMLMDKLVLASKEYNINTIAIAGGVAANSYLRSQLLHLAEDLDWNVFIPDFEYCTDNAAMIATAGYYQFLSGIQGNLSDQPQPRMAF